MRNLKDNFYKDFDLKAVISKYSSIICQSGIHTEFIVLLSGSRKWHLLTLLDAVLDPWMIENVWRREAATRISHEQACHQVLGLVRDLAPLVLWKRVISMTNAFKQSILNTFIQQPHNARFQVQHAQKNETQLFSYISLSAVFRYLLWLLTNCGF